MNQVPENRTLSIAEELSKRVRAFKKKRPHLSSQQIAKRFDISSSSLNRIENMDIKTPSFDQIIKILRGTGNEDDIISYIEANYPELSQTVRKHYQSEKFWKSLSREFIDALKDPETSKILFLVTTRKETSLDYIQNHFGLEGIKIVKRLQLQNFINIKNGFASLSSKTHLDIPNAKDVKELLTSLITDSFNSSGADQRTALNRIAFRVEAVNAQKALPIIIDVIDEANSKIVEVMKSDEMKGDDPVFFGLVSDTLIPNTLSFERSQMKGKMQ